MSPQPLKVPSTPLRSAENDKEKTPVAPKHSGSAKLGTIAPKDISSPHELTAFVETLLEQLELKFDDMSTQILGRMEQMSTRVDALEASIQDIINGDAVVSVPQSPAPGTPADLLEYCRYSKKRQISHKGLLGSIYYVDVTSTLAFNASKVEMTTSGIQEPPSFSRFHAIVAAKPLHGFGPPVIERHIAHEPWSLRFHNGKRKRDTPGVSMANKAVKRDHESNLGREPTKLYSDREELLRSLKSSFSQGPDVDFHGMYELSDSGVTHKQRIQTVTHGIWKTTGYRFTVKDHPQVTNGHKTRFWCSQDEAHRSKSSRAARKAQGNSYAPRVTSGGEIMAKARYPCRSRLLISSRDSDKAGMRIITVRMHHHFAHEPYVDSNLPPEVAQGIWESFGWFDQSGSRPSSALNDNTIEDQEVGSSRNAIVHQETEEGSSSEDDDKDSPAPILDEERQANDSFPIDNNPSGSLTDIYHDRMRAHIKNLREFCDGLEYQLQFNDYRMLNVLEREGGSFLNLVEDCLRKEGRLLSVERPVSSHSDIQQDHVLISSGSNEPPDNPGINPEALSH